MLTGTAAERLGRNANSLEAVRSVDAIRSPAPHEPGRAGNGEGRHDTMGTKSLSARFVSGDVAAVQEIYQRYGRTIYGIGFRMLGDAGLAEEVVQQTFLQAWRAAARFNPDRDLAPWLYTIGRRVAVDIYRRERRHRTEELGDTDVAEFPVTFEGTWAAWQVRQALATLPADERKVLRATHFEGLTHDETARRLGIPLGTVKSRTHRAYRRLTDLLAHLEEAAQ